MTHTLIPVRTIRRPQWRPPTSDYLPVPRRTLDRIAVEVRAEIDVMVSQLPPFGPVVVPDSGLCHGLIREQFQGHEIEYFCVKDKGHDGDCSDDKPIEAIAEVLEVLPLDHAGAWGCLDAPVST